MKQSFVKQTKSYLVVLGLIVSLFYFKTWLAPQPNLHIAKKIDTLWTPYYQIRDSMVLSEIENIVSKTRKNNKVDPIVKMHIEDLKRKQILSPDVNLQNLGQTAHALVVQRNTTLTKIEEMRIQSCVETASRDRSKSNVGFFGKNEFIRRNHHSYLNNEKIMIEIGGNWGWDAGNFSKLFNPRYIILEPLEDYVKILEKKFEKNPQVVIYKLGLGATNEKLMVKLEGNNACATSKFSGVKGDVPIYISNAKDFFTDLGVGIYDVDLLTMNCEGCEYEVLETLVKTNMISRFRNIQWGTHSSLKGLQHPFSRYCRIQEILSRTHRPTYHYKFIWESWRRLDVR